MNRLLLALLALLTGLAAQVSPAQARLSGASDTEIGAVEGMRSAARTALPAQSISAPVVRQERREQEAARSKPVRSRVYIPSVLFGVDRAFE
mgnify:CR=1 FL=1